MKQFDIIIIFIGLGIGIAQESVNFVEEDAHVHGVASLNIAQDGKNLLIEFMSPAVNLIGFEYQPSSVEDKTSRAALASLAKLLEFFTASSAA